MFEEMKIGDLIKLTACLSGQKNAKENETEDHGFAVVVLDHGFVYVGKTSTDDQWCRITDASNIRYWGTSKGLGQLVVEGPTGKTKLDFVGNLLSPIKSVISIHPTKEDLWNRS